MTEFAPHLINQVAQIQKKLKERVLRCELHSTTDTPAWDVPDKESRSHAEATNAIITKGEPTK